MNSLQNRIQGEAYHVVFLQFGVIIFIAGCAFLFQGVRAGLSALLGGGTYGFANLLFVTFVFRFTRAQQMPYFLAAFVMGESLKLILSAILFLVIVKYLPVSLLSVLVGFIGAIMAFWIACIWHFSKQSNFSKNGSG